MTEDKKGVLVRLPQKLHQDLLREASQESVKRGETVSVPRLILKFFRRGPRRRNEVTGGSG